MRHQYTCIFSDVLTSRVWAQPTSTRAVWLWFQLSADPEGFVPATTSGVAIGAHVSESEAKEAIAFLSSADLDGDPEDPNLGRIIERVARGWRVLGFVEQRERAKYEAGKARNRNAMARSRAARREAANDTSDTQPAIEALTGVRPVTENPGSVYQPKPTPKPTPSSSATSEAPKAPVADVGWQSTKTVIHEIPDSFGLTEELRMAAKLAGVKDPDAALARLRRGPIGGARGIFMKDLHGYIRDTCIPAWRKFEEVERFKGGTFPGNTPGEPEKAPPRVKGMPPWVYESHKVACDIYGLDLKTEAKSFQRDHHIPPKNLQPNDAAQAFTQWLIRRGKGEAA